ncbi:MAG TPA: hypothetical protein DCM38_09980 [Gammaproteobacteria bacterium]|nr:hypothetical protein [Gammaproteobacteria bacterium]
MVLSILTFRYHYLAIATGRVSLLLCSTTVQGIELIGEAALFIHWLSHNQIQPIDIFIKESSTLGSLDCAD